MESNGDDCVSSDVNANMSKQHCVSCMSELDDVIKKTSLIDLHDSCIDGNHENEAFSMSSSPLSKIMTPDIFSSPIQESTSKIMKKIWKDSNCLAERRKRRFGRSCHDSILPKYGKITKQHKTSPKMQIRKCCRKNYKIFSTCVTPCPSPTSGFINSHIFRLSGISMSPSTPIAWMTQSPIELDSVNSGSSFFSKPSPENIGQKCENSLENSSISAKSSATDKTTSSQRLQVSDDSCPPDKLYFWQDDVSELVADDKLGCGGFGQVFEGTYRGTKVAIKKMKNEFKQKKATFENFIGEVMSLRLSHPNIVRSLVLIQPPNSPLTPGSKGSSYLVMELAGSRNLLQMVNDANEIILNSVKLSFCADILKGLTYLHDNGMAHLDLKPGNVIVTSQNLCKICDFGSCKLVQMTAKARENLAFASFLCSSTPPSGDSQFSFSSTSGPKKQPPSLLMGTLIYRAPELLQGFPPTLKADMFSFGITAWQIWRRINPYYGLHQHTAVYSIVAFGKRPEIPDFDENSNCFDVEFAKIVKACWAKDYTHRPSSKQTLKNVQALSEETCKERQKLLEA